MSKNQNLERCRLTQNQKKVMSDDPGEGGRKGFTARDDDGVPPSRQPDVRGSEALRAFRERCSGQA